MGDLADDKIIKEILRSITSGNASDDSFGSIFDAFIEAKENTPLRKIERLEKEVADLKKELAESILLGGAGMDRNALKNLIREVMLEALANKESK